MNGASSSPATSTSISGASSSNSGTTVNPAPSSSNGNRFSNFIQRRRGNSSVVRPVSAEVMTGESTGLGTSSTASNTEVPASPAKAGSSYGFPSLRRRLSRSASSQQDVTGVSNGAAMIEAASGSSSNNGGSRPNIRRTNSSPRDALSFNSRSRPGNSSTDIPVPPLPGLEPLTVTMSLPDRVRNNEGGGGGGEPSTPTRTAPGSPTTANPPLPEAATHNIRLVPHLESNRSLHFDLVDRTLAPFSVVSVGRFTDRSAAAHPADPARIAFKSKVVSRGHADIWCDNDGKFFIRDTKSSSGTFLNHIRLSGPGAESRPFPLKDGDILQLGVDYQGGTEEIYKCVKSRVELNRGWQRKKSSFNTNAMKQLRELGAGASSAVDGEGSPEAARKASPPSSITDCCICLYPVTICQALFIAPCSHVTHFKCIRPLLTKTYPGFTCPSCRTFGDLEADVEIEEPWEPDVVEVIETPIIEEEEEEVVLEGSEPEPDVDPSLSIDDEPSTDTKTIPLAIAPSRSTLLGATLIGSSASEVALASLVDAATPRNQLFLSTLADTTTTFTRLHQASTSSSSSASSASAIPSSSRLAATTPSTNPTNVVGTSSASATREMVNQRLSMRRAGSASEGDEDEETDATEEGSSTKTDKGKGREVIVLPQADHQSIRKEPERSTSDRRASTVDEAVVVLS